MAFTCGFFNSENGDRKYNAEQMSAIFDGIIADGVFTTIGDHLAVSAGTGMQVLVGTGKAWFDHTWNVNDAAYPLAIAASDVTLSRIDAIVLETNHSDSVRLNKLRVVQGTVAASPVKPTLTNSEKVHQHPLAWVTVAPGVTQIAASAIENAVGTSACPFVTGVIETTAIDDLFNQWNGEFDEWFDNLKAQLSDNVVANLQKQIDANKTQIQKNWDNTLKKYTKELLGIPEDAVPDDAFMALLVGTDSKAYRVKVQYPDGSPAVGYTISGIDALPTTTLITNSDGMVLGKSTSNSPTITVTKKYDDVKAASVVVNSTGTITDTTITLEYDEDVKTITSSKTLKPNVSPKCQKIDYILVGGGGGGSAGVGASVLVNGYGGSGGGAGGGGGYHKQGSTPFKSEYSLAITIGAGGSLGNWNSAGSTGVGGTGGTSSMKNNVTGETITANGGNGGSPATLTKSYDPGTVTITNRSVGGTGNGNGASGGYISVSGIRLRGDDEYYGGYISDQSNGIAGGGAINISFRNTSVSVGGGGGAGSAYAEYPVANSPVVHKTVLAVAGVTTGYGYGGTGANGITTGDGSDGGTNGAKGVFLYAFNHVA